MERLKGTRPQLVTFMKELCGENAAESSRELFGPPLKKKLNERVDTIKAFTVLDPPAPPRKNVRFLENGQAGRYSNSAGCSNKLYTPGTLISQHARFSAQPTSRTTTTTSSSMQTDLTSTDPNPNPIPNSQSPERHAANQGETQALTAGQHKEILHSSSTLGKPEISIFILEVALAPDKLDYFLHMELAHPRNSLTGSTLYLIEAVCKRKEVCLQNAGRRLTPKVVIEARLWTVRSLIQVLHGRQETYISRQC